MSDGKMIGPAGHEDAALEALVHGETEEATVRAVLALASAVNRLAAAQEGIAGRSG